MKKLKIVSIVLEFAFLISVFISCGTVASDDKKDSEQTINDFIDISSYTIIRSDSASRDVIGVTSLLKREILEYCISDIKVGTDSDISKEYEILVGNTDRDDSRTVLEAVSAKASQNAFAITFTDNKIVIVGLSDNDLILGVKYFINTYVKSSTSNNCLYAKKDEKAVVKKTGNLLYHNDNYDSIVLETLTDIDCPALTDDARFSYAKIVKLEHSEKNNGILFSASEGFNMQPWKLYRSNDDGKTWSKLANIVDEVNGYIPGYQPYLYELPVDMGDYKKGTLLMAACSRNAAENERTHIILQASTDLGESWTGVCNIAIGGSFSDGIWEPVLQYDEHTKKLYCFYSDQSDENYSQKLVFKSTTDLKNWSGIKDMVALSDSTLAPGMVALTKMGNGKWALAYEIGSSIGPYIYIKIADSIDDWNPLDKGKPVADKNTGGMCRSGPAIAWTPAGGDCGTLIVTSHDDQNNAGTETKCGLFLSFDYGKNFVVIENPIPNMSNEFCSSGYSPGFYVDKEGTVYYVNNPECYRNSFNEKLMFARIKVY